MITHTTLTRILYKPFIVSASVLGAGAHGKASGNNSYMDSQEVVGALASVFPSPMTDQTQMRAASIVHSTRVINCERKSSGSVKLSPVSEYCSVSGQHLK